MWDSAGRLATAGASTYKLPSWTEVPDIFEVNFLERAAEPGVIFGSKAVGEPPLMLAISVREAIRDAIAQFGAGGPISLESPATPERVFFAIRRARAEREASSRYGWCDSVTPASRGELLRAPLFHTPRNPLRETGALECFPDGGLLIRDGRIAGCGDYAALRAAHPNVPSTICAAAFFCRASSTRTFISRNCA